jgi:hypothetical protein
MPLQGDEALRRRLAAIGDTKVLLGKVALLGVAEAKKLVPRATSNLGRTIRVGTVTDKSAQVVAGGTSSVGYARYVEEGTGLYGPRKRRITPKNGKVLSWKRRGSASSTMNIGGFAVSASAGSSRAGSISGVSTGAARPKARSRVFARSVRGRKATPYLVPGVKRAVERAGVRDTIVKLWNDAA